jgi:hypothetical protein
LDRTAGRQAHRGGLRSAWHSKKTKTVVRLVRFAYFPGLATISALHLARYKNICHFERCEKYLFSYIQNEERFLALLGMTNKGPIPQP